MGMSTYVRGFKPPDERWQAMKAVHDACHAAKIPVPTEVGDYFEWEEPDPAGVEVDLKGHPSVTEFAGDSEQGFEIDVTKLPKEITAIRFVNGW